MAKIQSKHALTWQKVVYISWIVACVAIGISGLTYRLWSVWCDPVAGLFRCGPITAWLLRQEQEVQPIEIIEYDESAQLEFDSLSPMRFVTLEVKAWDTVIAVLERAWVLSWDNGAPPAPTMTTEHYVCWHIAELDTVVYNEPVQTWRCEFTGTPPDPENAILVGDGVHWEMRYPTDDSRIELWGGW